MQSKSISTHQTCPSCGHHGCYTSFDDGGGYCHSCSYSPKKSVPEMIEEDLDLTFEARTYSDISQEVIDFTGVQTGVLPSGVEYNRVYPYPHGTKQRILPKDFSKNAGFTNDHLFLMNKYNAGSSKKLTIVEGEDDALAALTILGNKWPVVAIPGASISRALMKNCKQYIDSFESIIIATDGDDAGDRAALQIETLFPNKCYRVQMTKHKDAKDYLTNGDGKEWLYSWLNAKKFVKKFDTNTPAQFKKMLSEARDDIYLPTGISTYDEVAQGLFQGHYTVFTAPEGIGKTELMRYLEYNLIKNHPDVPFAYCHLEEVPQRSLLGLVSYHLNKNVTRKDLITNIGEVEEAIDQIMGRETVHQFTVGVDEDPDVLIDRVKYFSQVCGCKYVFFEPVQDLAHQREKGMGLTEYLDQMAVKMSRTAAETGCGIVCIAHANEDGDTRDSKQLQKQASVRVELQRDMSADDPVLRNTTKLIVRKNRPSSYVGPAGEMLFNLKTFTMQEHNLF